MNGVLPTVDDGSYPHVGVGVLVIDDDERILLTLRRLPPEAGSWSILGGKLEFMETLEDCAKREASEEAGVQVTLERLLCVTDHLLPEEGQHWISPAYLGRIVSGEPRNCEPDKTSEMSWVRIDQLPRNLTITARKAIEAYRRIRPAATCSATAQVESE